MSLSHRPTTYVVIERETFRDGSLSNYVVVLVSSRLWCLCASMYLSVSLSQSSSAQTIYSSPLLHLPITFYFSRCRRPFLFHIQLFPTHDHCSANNNYIGYTRTSTDDDDYETIITTVRGADDESMGTRETDTQMHTHPAA